MRTLTVLVLFLWATLAAHVPASLAVDPAAISFGCVNVITGDYCESHTDMVVNCFEPIEIRRTHVSSDESRNTGGKWRSCGEVITVHKVDGHLAAFLEEENGSVVKFPIGGTKGPELSHTYCNTSGGGLSGQTDLRNYRLSYGGMQVILTTGSGERRIYHCLSDDAETCFRLSHGEIIEGARWVLKEVIRPNGNCLLYDYADPSFAENGVLRYGFKIRSADRSRTTEFGWASYEYQAGSNAHLLTVKSSEGRSIGRWIEIQRTLPGGSREGHFLLSVTGPCGYFEGYDYDLHCHDIPRSLQLAGRTLPEGRGHRVEYYRKGEQWTAGMRHHLKKNDPMSGWVIRHTAPVGPGGAMCAVAEYRYGFLLVDNRRRKFRREHWTDVLDAGGGQTRYEYDGNLRLTAITRLDPQVVSREQLVWDGASLVARCQIDGDGCAVSAVTYKYDGRGNVLEETTWGNLTGTSLAPLSLDARGMPIDNGVERHTVHRTYSDDRFNLLLSEADGRTTTRFFYVQDTNLLSSRLVYEEGVVKERYFHFYDRMGSLASEAEDNGTGENFGDLRGSSYRRIVRYTPDIFNPGFPCEIAEYYRDSSSGREVLVSRETLGYNFQHQVIGRTHYGSSGEDSRLEMFNYDERGRRTSRRDFSGRTTHTSYDANGNQTRILKEGAGYCTENTYDKGNRLTQTDRVAIDGTRLTKSFAYDPLGRVVADVDTCGRQTEYVLDKQGRTVKEIGPPIWTESGWIRPEIKREFDSLDRLVSETDALGYTNRYEYNARGDVTGHLYPDGTEERFEYTLQGSLAAQTHRNRSVERFKRDYCGRVVRRTVEGPIGDMLTVTQTIYDGSKVIAEIDGEGRETRYQYDERGRLSGRVIGDARTQWQYDKWGRKAKKLRWLNTKTAQSTVWEYDELDRVTSEREEDATGQVTARTDYQYDSDGNQTASIVYADAVAHATTLTEYDMLRRVVVQTDPLGGTTHFSYDYHTTFEGEPVLAQIAFDSMNQKTTKLLDSSKRPLEVVVSQDDSILSSKRICYDLNGNPTLESHEVINVSEPVRSFAIRRAWGPCNRLEDIIEGWGSPLERSVQLLYNAEGQLASTILPDGSENRRTYDALGRLQTHSGAGFGYAYEYDRCDNILAVSSSEGILRRSYDTLGRLIEETLPTGLSTQFDYDALGRRTTLRMPGGCTVDYEYDSYRLLAVHRGDAQGKRLYSHRYDEYDFRGLPLSQTLIDGTTRTQIFDALGRVTHNEYEQSVESDFDYDPIGNLLSYRADEQEFTYSYDDLYQLVGENDHTYQFDSIYNRISTDGHDHRVNDLNQPMRYADAPLEHDSKGNLVKWGDDRYIYDGLGRLIEATVDGSLVTFTYDAFDRCLTRAVGSRVQQHYLYDNQCEIGAVNSKQEVTELRVLGIGRGAEVGATIAIELAGVIHTPRHDFRGSIVAAGGESYSYSAFGVSDDPSQNPWRFMSKREDPLTGLINFGRRLYSPHLGRWMTPDPKGYQDGPNLYAYCINCPLTSLDLWGLETEGRFPRTREFLDNIRQSVGSFILRLVDPERSPFTGNWGKPGPEYLVRSTGYTDDIGGIRDFATNGLNNSRADAERAALSIADRTGRRCDYIYNRSYGRFGDIVRAILVRFGVEHPAVAAHVDYFRSELDSHEGPAFFRWTPHSEGVMIARQTLKKLAPEHTACMLVEACGGPVRLRSDEAAHAVNHVATGDPVARLGGSFLRIPSEYTLRFHQNSVSRMSFSNHSFLGSSYENVPDILSEYYESLIEGAAA